MNKTALIIVAVLLIGAILFFRIKPATAAIVEPLPVNGEGSDNKFIIPNENQLMEYFRQLSSTYSPTIAQNIERIYRLETANFTSGQYKKCGSPGMLAFSHDYPYGWSAPRKLWDNNVNTRPIGIAEFVVGGKTYKYLMFRDFISAASTLAEYLLKYPPGRWNTTDPIGQAIYTNKLNAITLKYT